MTELPVLIASVDDPHALRTYQEAAAVGGVVEVPLKWAPTTAEPHVLEVYTKATNEPLRMLAEPLGGNRLRLYPYEEIAPEVVPENGDPLAGRRLANGRLELSELIGTGSIGVVYRGHSSGLGKPVAVKILHEAFQRDAAFCQRFYDEARALSLLDHPNLVHVYDFGQESDGLLYMSMAFASGKTLREVQASERLDVSRIVGIMRQVAAGLGHAHSRGLLHRDVKPDNVMLVAQENDDGVPVETVKLLDFGFAVPPAASGEVTQRLAGTPVYMSPEQCRGEELDARSDVYACGVMMYELASGRVPFLSRDTQKLHRLHLEKEPAPIASPLAGVVLKALAKSKGDRQASMQELRSELKAAALYHARTLASSADERIAFVTQMKALGVAALAVVRYEVQRVTDPELLEDLLLAMPVATDEACAARVAELTRSSTPTVCRAAARALPRLWNARAREWLEPLLRHEEERVRAAALVGLKEIGALSDADFARLAAVVTPGRVG